MANNDTYYLMKGLGIAGYTSERLAMRTQLRRFREMFGCSPTVVRHLWNDLRLLLAGDVKDDYLFWALCFLKRYPTEGDLAGRLKKDPSTIRKWVWTVIFGIQDLRAKKVNVDTAP